MAPAPKNCPKSPRWTGATAALPWPSVGSAFGGGRGMHSVSVRVLGPFEVRVDDRPVSLPAGRLRTLLAALAMSANKPMSVDHLAAAVWGERLPRNATRSLQTYAGRLRSALGGARIDSNASGFALGIDPDAVDALRFVRLLDESVRQHAADAGRALLTEALGLWRGEPFEGIASTWLRDTDSPGWWSAICPHSRGGSIWTSQTGGTTSWRPSSAIWWLAFRCASRCGFVCSWHWVGPVGSPRRWSPTRSSVRASRTSLASIPASSCDECTPSWWPIILREGRATVCRVGGHARHPATGAGQHRALRWAPRGARDPGRSTRRRAGLAIHIGLCDHRRRRSR